MRGGTLSFGELIQNHAIRNIQRKSLLCSVLSFGVTLICGIF